MATIHKRRLRSGQVVWELTHGTGKDRRRFIAGRTKEEAAETLKQFERQLALHGQAPSDDSVIAVMGLYREYLKTNRRPATTTRYTRVLRTFEECFLRVRFPDVGQLRQLRPLHIEEYKRVRSEGSIQPEEKTQSDAARELHLRLQVAARAAHNAGAKARAQFGWLGRHPVKQKVSARTVNYELRVLFTFCHWAIKRNHLFLNPCSTIERFRLPKRAIPKFMTSEELKKFFAACDPFDQRLFMSILLTGMRKGEVEHLLWSDVSFELGIVFIQEKPDVGWKPKTDERLIPVSPLLQEVLLQHFATRRSDVLVFANEAGSRDTHILDRLKAACRKAGIKISTVHALRHSFGAHLRMAGVSLADIGDLLGHKDLATTQIYAKVQQEHLRSMVSRLAPLASSIGHTDFAPRKLENQEPNTDQNPNDSTLSQPADQPPQ